MAQEGDGVREPWVGAANLPLLTDLYEFTMLEVYLREQMHEEATFSLFCRKLPRERNFLVSCGLELVLDSLESLHFDDAAIEALASLRMFSSRTLEYLAHFAFSGDVYAMPEGTPLFAGEPLLEVVAPLPQAQLLESWLLNQMNVQTMAASKAARVVEAAGGRSVIDFGLRRMHGADAGLKVARAAYLAGANATSNVLAGALFGIPVAGTMAHSFIQACPDQLAAFRAMARAYPQTVLLVDTYDTLDGVGDVIRLAHELGPAFQISSIRLDSGDLLELSRRARAMLDAANLHAVKIFASGGLDEHRIAALVAAGASVDGFGVGTALGVSDDAPSLDLVYKLVEYAGEDRTKLSTGKMLLPGRKQVFRIERGGQLLGDLLAGADERHPGRALLEPVMRGGRRCQLRRPLPKLREDATTERMRLSQALRDLRPFDAPAPVRVSAGLLDRYRRLAGTLGYGASPAIDLGPAHG